jgi:hypothetical protein
MADFSRRGPEEGVSVIFGRVLSGDQAAADTVKAELTGCFSFDIPLSSASRETAGNNREANVSLMFDQALSGDQSVADAVKATLTGCQSFDIPTSSGLGPASVTVAR